MPPLIWPLPGQAPLFPDAPGRFAARRTHENHTGVDLYAETGQPVVSTEDGVVIGIECFTGAHVPETASFWWNDTWAVLVEGASGVVVYGEIRPGVEVGQRLRAGDLVEAEADLHSFLNRTDKTVRYIVIKQVLTGEDKADLLQHDKQTE